MAGNQTFSKIGSVGQITINIYNSSVDTWQATLSVDVKDADGKAIFNVSGNLTDYLTENQENGLTTFLNGLRTKALNELL